LLRRSALGDIIPWADRHGAGVVVYSALQSGMLTGRLTRERANEMAQDWRGQSPELHEPLLTDCLDVQPLLRQIGEQHETFGGVVAISWALAQPGVSGAIVGGRTRTQVEEWLAAGDLQLGLDDISELERATHRFTQIEPPEPV
jgi:aryl-alcohol dehydrogenase-like predicted oxidoreductase